MTGWSVVCPDGKERHAPHRAIDDAECVAEFFTENGCRPSDDAVARLGRCQGGEHRVEATIIAPFGHTGSA